MRFTDEQISAIYEAEVEMLGIVISALEEKGIKVEYEETSGKKNELMPVVFYKGRMLSLSVFSVIETGF